MTHGDVRHIATAPGWAERKGVARPPTEQPSRSSFETADAAQGTEAEKAIRSLCDGMLAEMCDLADEADLRADLFDRGLQAGEDRARVDALRAVAVEIRSTVRRIRFEVDISENGLSQR